MKREIKFRAWDDGRKEMHHDFQFIKSGDDGNDWIIFISDKQTLKTGFEVHVHNPYFRQQFRIMQFTGLKDKNGKEIYEGDVVRYCVSAPWDDEVPLEVKAEVVFDDPFYGCFCARSRDGHMDATGCLYEHIDGIEVIGNIWENPELLNA